MKLNVGCRLNYTATEPTCFIFQIQASQADGQTVLSEELILPVSPTASEYEVFTHPTSGTRVVRTILGPGPIVVEYRAEVSQPSLGVDPSLVEEMDFNDLPMNLIEYLAPSRYCASDTFADFAFQTFGHHERGHERVTAVCKWIHDHITYTAGSTGPASTATDVFVSRKGVCRDFAHLGITICRALGIPARYASVYASAMSPQDFHAIFQAYLRGPDGGAWVLHLIQPRCRRWMPSFGLPAAGMLRTLRSRGRKARWNSSRRWCGLMRPNERIQSRRNLQSRQDRKFQAFAVAKIDHNLNGCTRCFEHCVSPYSGSNGASFPRST